MKDHPESGEAVLPDCLLLESLSPEERQLLGGVAKRHTVSQGERLFLLGDPAERIYVVEQGTIALTFTMNIRGEMREVVIGHQEARTTVGWSALVPPYRRTLGAKAASEATLWSLPRDGLQEIFAQHPAIELALFRNLCRVISDRLTLMEAILLRDLQKWVSEVT